MPSATTRTVEEINAKLAGGDAVVMTASELCQAVRRGDDIAFDDIDVVTTATCGLMSGTFAVLSFEFAGPNEFVKARRVFFNGVEGHPGPCPNERIGLIDAIVYGTRHSRDDARYGGGHLFRDIVAGETIQVEVETQSGRQLTGSVTIDRMPHAMLYGSRHAFRNYVGFVNPGREPVTTIFCSQPLPPDLAAATACGCGEINPLQNDPDMETIGIGSRVMLNGGTGYVTGPGTRSSKERPNLSVVADMHTMNHKFMGGFQTSAGPEVIQTWAVPIPVLNQKVLLTVKTLDEQIPLTITDIRGRAPLAEGTYADLWQQTSRSFSFDEGACRKARASCPDCPPAMLCPSCAFTDQKVAIDAARCFHCGICLVSCHGDCFSGDLGSVAVDGERVPFIQRLSDRLTASAAALELKKKIIDNRFFLTGPLEKIEIK